MNVVKFYETLAKIIAEKENIHIKVHTQRKGVSTNDKTDGSPKGSVSSN